MMRKGLATAGRIVGRPTWNMWLILMQDAGWRTDRESKVHLAGATMKSRKKKFSANFSIPPKQGEADDYFSSTNQSRGSDNF